MPSVSRSPYYFLGPLGLGDPPDAPVHKLTCTMCGSSFWTMSDLLSYCAIDGAVLFLDEAPPSAVLAGSPTPHS